MDAEIVGSLFLGGFLVAVLILASRAGRRNHRNFNAPNEAKSERPVDRMDHGSGRAPPPQVPIERSRPAPATAPPVRSFTHNFPATGLETLCGPVWVIDGDSIIIKKREMRLFGIDAPEINHPFGKQAKWALHKLCKGQEVRADIICQDHYGRTVARCFLPDGRDLSAEMVKLGLAIDWAKFSGGRYRPFEVEDARKRMWLADARQKGRMHVWDAYDARRRGADRAAR